MLSSFYARNRVFIWMCVLITFNHLSLGSVQPSLSLHARDLGALQWAIGFAFGVVGFGRFLATMPAGFIADHFGRKYALVLAGLVLVLGNFICGFASDYILLIIGRLISGIGVGMVITTGQVVVIDITTSENRGRTLAIYRSVSTFALGFSPYPGGILATHFGFQAPFFANVVAGVLVGVVAWFFVPAKSNSHVNQDMKSNSGFASRTMLIIRSPGFILAALVGFTIGAAREGAFKTLVPLIGHDRLSLNPEQVGLSIAIASVVGLLAAYPSGYLVDRYGHKVIIVPALIMAGISLYLFLIAPTSGWFTVGCAAWCLAIGVCGLVPVAYAIELAPAGMNASVVSSYHLLADLGAFAGPAIVGLIADLSSIETAIEIMIGCLGVLGFVFAIYARPPIRQMQAKEA